MSFDNGAIDSRGEAKVIRIDYETAHRVSLAGERDMIRGKPQPEKTPVVS